MKAKNYIRMCEQAKEIQKLFNPDGHNHVCLSGGTIWTQIDRDSYKYDKYTEYGHQYICIRDGYLMHCVWIPTQEQLQGILKKPLWWLVWHFEEFVEPMSDKTFFQDTSMDELWLAFVMKEKYHKIWDGKTWVKST